MTAETPALRPTQYLLDTLSALEDAIDTAHAKAVRRNETYPAKPFALPHRKVSDCYCPEAGLYRALVRYFDELFEAEGEA